MNIKYIIERDYILDEIKKFGIQKQYQKSKNLIILGILGNVDLKLRQPKENKIYQFRITRKYRAFCVLDKDTLRIMRIDKHQ